MQGVEWIGQGPPAPEAWHQLESSITRQACHSDIVGEYSLAGGEQDKAESAAWQGLHKHLGDEFALPSCGAMPGMIQGRWRDGGGWRGMDRERESWFALAITTGASGRRICTAVLWSNARYAYTVEGAGWRGMDWEGKGWVMLKRCCRAPPHGCCMHGCMRFPSRFPPHTLSPAAGNVSHFYPHCRPAAV